jgi:hypothetical protein
VGRDLAPVDVLFKGSMDAGLEALLQSLAGEGH